MVDTDPAVSGVLEHVEGVSAVYLLPWQLSILSWVVNVLIPHGVDAGLEEEVGGCAFTQSEDASEGVV